MNDVPGFPYGGVGVHTVGREPVARAFRRSVQGRWWFWVSSAMLQHLDVMDALGPGWAVAYWAPWYDLKLIVKEPALPLVKAWCWFWTRARWLPFIWAIRLGIKAHDEWQEIEPWKGWQRPSKWWGSYFKYRHRHPFCPPWPEWKTGRFFVSTDSLCYWPEKIVNRLWNLTRIVVDHPAGLEELPFWWICVEHQWSTHTYVRWPLHRFARVRRWALRTDEPPYGE